MKKLFIPLAFAALAVPGIALADAAGDAKSNGCLKCHAVDKKKDGPAFKEVAKKYKGKADAEAKLTAMLSKGVKIKVDGVEEDHKTVKGGDAAVAGGIAKWILAM
ncbi:MAG: class I cytochrome c [Betaproteobacteria bacterium]|nr:class I cytochrome c [Betaproteobacteria bacterium]